MITQKLSHQNVEGYRTYIQDLDVKKKKRETQLKLPQPE